MESRSLPSDRRTLDLIAAEAEIAERAVASRIASVRALELVIQQREDPVFQGEAAQAHLRDELARLRAALARPCPDLTSAGPHLVLPDRDLPPGEFLRLFHADLVRLRRDVLATLAGLDRAEAEDADLAATRRALAGSRRGVEIVEYLATCPGRTATLRNVAIKVYRCRPEDAFAGEKTVRTQADRLADKLDSESAPLRLVIHDGAVSLQSAGDDA